MKRLPGILGEVEQKLATFYGFVPKATAATHLVTREQLCDTLGEKVRDLPEFAARAGVFLVDGPDAARAADVFIGIHLDPSITTALENHDPTVRLDGRNLDPFCVVVEEVSHFHLILNRASREQGVSKLELEWQGEVDKLVVCAETLGAQHGDPHLPALARILFDGALIESGQEHYWEATRQAARFWYEALRSDTELSPRLRQLLRQAYDGPWTEKVRLAG